MNRQSAKMFISRMSGCLAIGDKSIDNIVMSKSVCCRGAQEQLYGVDPPDHE